MPIQPIQLVQLTTWRACISTPKLYKLYRLYIYVWGSVMSDGRHYSIVPIRAIGLVKRGMTWRTLAALCAHTSKSGVCYPNQTTLGDMAGMDRAHYRLLIKRP